MAEEFNIFKNLEELRKTNLLDQLKSLEAAKTNDLNDSQGLDNDDFDFSSLVNNSSLTHGPTNQQPQKEKIPTAVKKTKKNATTRRSSISTDGSISPAMPLLDGLSTTVHEMPVSRRTRSSLGASKKSTESDKTLENIEHSPYNRGQSKGRGRGRGRAKGRRGRGRGRANTSVTTRTSRELQNNTIEIPDETPLSCNESSDHVSSALTIMQRFLQQDNRGRTRVMRARRQYVAEIAARSTQVDYVDLVSSPMPRVEGFIDLDADVEESKRPTRSKKKTQDNFNINSSKSKNATANCTGCSLDVSFDEDNPELNIKINWKGKPESFKLRKHQKFSIIFKQLAERENISMESIVFNLNNRIIMADDTPDSIEYKIFHFIDGRVLANYFNSPGAASAASKKRDPNNITLKIQSDKWKRPLQINIKKDDKFRILYIKCAEELKVGVDELKLSFDGELLEMNDTPADLDFEGGEAIDLHIKN